MADPETGQGTGIDPRVLPELWTSFVALLRSYLSGAEAYLPEGARRVQLTASPEGEVIVVTPACYLALEANLADGNGYWALYEGTPDPETMIGDGIFRLTPDSMMEWTGIPGKVEMDRVAEALTMMILEDPGEGQTGA